MMMIENNIRMKIPTHRHNVFVVGGEGDAVDAVLVTRELGHAGLVLRGRQIEMDYERPNNQVF